MKKTIGLYICLLYGFHLSPNAQTGQTTQTDTISQRIVLIGDAGELTNGRHPVVEAVKQFIKLDKKTTVLYLGDNLYDTGLPDDQSALY
ncbi:MAG TPA: hypothetical protein VFT15_02035, partial [Chitinophagaceae bacterium]|nr:hypothetical protein [Chitinophagaceae bacterium]